MGPYGCREPPGSCRGSFRLLCNLSFTMQPIVLAVLAALAGAIVALAIYHFVVVTPALARSAASFAMHDDLLGAGAGAAGSRLASLEKQAAAAQNSAKGLQQRLTELEGLARTDMSGVGFVRYDAFDNTGSELSYALALLNREGDGVVLSSIYSREDSRTFGKAVEKFIPLANASAEELNAIARARGATS